MIHFSPEALDDMVKRRSQRQTLKDIAHAYDIPIHQLQRVLYKELRRRGIFLPARMRATTCTHPFFVRIDQS